MGTLSVVQSSRGDESCGCYVLGGNECLWECVEKIPLCEAVSTLTLTSGHTDSTEMVDIVERMKSFIESEMRSCSMDIGGITPEYVFRSWGRQVPLNEIELALKEINVEK